MRTAPPHAFGCKVHITQPQSNKFPWVCFARATLHCVSPRTRCWHMACTTSRLPLSLYETRTHSAAPMGTKGRDEGQTNVRNERTKGRIVMEPAATLRQAVLRQAVLRPSDPLGHGPWLLVRQRPQRLWLPQLPQRPQPHGKWQCGAVGQPRVRGHVGSRHVAPRGCARRGPRHGWWAAPTVPAPLRGGHARRPCGAPGCRRRTGQHHALAGAF